MGRIDPVVEHLVPLIREELHVSEKLLSTRNIDRPIPLGWGPTEAGTDIDSVVVPDSVHEAVVARVVVTFEEEGNLFRQAVREDSSVIEQLYVDGNLNE